MKLIRFVLLVVLIVSASTAFAEVTLPIQFSQRDPEWADEQYSNTPGKTIEQRGCLLCCCAMTLRHYGVYYTPKGYVVDPSLLNTWLRKNNGYIGRLIKLDRVAAMSRKAMSRNNGRYIKYKGGVRKSSDARWLQTYVDSDIATNHPVTLNVKSGRHFVIAILKMPFNNYELSDPWSYDNMNYLQNYGKVWRGTRVFNGYQQTMGAMSMETDIDPEGDISCFSVYATQGVNVLVTDPQGRRTGTDSGGVFYDEVTDAVSGIEYGLGNPDNDYDYDSNMYIVNVPCPVSGDYSVVISGTVGTAFTVQIEMTDSEGDNTSQEISGTIPTGGSVTYTPNLQSNITIGAAKFSGLTFVDLGSKVVTSASNSNAGMYIQESDGFSGIKVIPDPTDPDLPYQAGDIVDVSGTVQLVNGELQIQASEISPEARQGTDPKPKGIINRDLGGSALGSQPEVTGTHGLNNVGLLMKTWGSVTAVVGDNFYVDDGSVLLDGSGNQGVRVSALGLTKPDEDDYVAVTGISSVATVGGNYVRLLRARGQSDIDVIYESGGSLMAMLASTSESADTSENIGSGIFKPWPRPTAEEILNGLPFIRDDSQVGAIGWAIGKADGSILDLYGSIISRRIDHRTLALKEPTEPETGEPRLVLVLDTPIDTLAPWSQIDIIGSTLVTLQGGQRAIVGPKEVYRYADAKGNWLIPLPKTLGLADSWAYRIPVFEK
jgi:hypothetical protein